MSRFMNRRAALRAGLALCASLALPSARACEFFSSTLRVWHPWTRATAPDATSAIINMKIDQVSQSDRLIGVETPVAGGAELVRDGASSAVDLLIPQGQETLLGEEGIHIRLVDLKQPLLIARSYPLTLIFEKGGIVNANLNIDYMGGLPAFPSRVSRFSVSPDIANGAVEAKGEQQK